MQNAAEHIDSAQRHLPESPAWGNDNNLWTAVDELARGLEEMRKAFAIMAAENTDSTK